MLESKFTLTGVPGICLAEHGMPVAGDNLSGFQEAPDVLLELVIGSVEADILDDLHDKKVNIYYIEVYFTKKSISFRLCLITLLSLINVGLQINVGSGKNIKT